MQRALHKVKIDVGDREVNTFAKLVGKGYNIAKSCES